MIKNLIIYGKNRYLNNMRTDFTNNTIQIKYKSNKLQNYVMIF